MAPAASTMKLTQRQTAALKQIPKQAALLKLRGRLFSAPSGNFEEFLLRFTEENHFLSYSSDAPSADRLFFPALSDRKSPRRTFYADPSSVTDILEATASQPSTLKSSLTEQLRWERLSEKETEIGELLISGLDANGYWIRDPRTGETFPESEKNRQPQNAALIDKMTALIRRLDPPGAATKNRFEAAAVIAADDPGYPPEAKAFYAELFELTESGEDWNEIPRILREKFGEETVESVSRLPVPASPGSSQPQPDGAAPDATAVIAGKKIVSVSVPADRILDGLKLAEPEDGRSSAGERSLAEAVLYAAGERCRLLKAAVRKLTETQIGYLTGATAAKSRLTQTQTAASIGTDPPKLSRLLKNKIIEIKLKGTKDGAPVRSFTVPAAALLDRSGSGSLSRTEIEAAMSALRKEYGEISDSQMSRLLKTRGIGICKRTVCKYRSQINRSGGKNGTFHSGNSL